MLRSLIDTLRDLGVLIVALLIAVASSVLVMVVAGLYGWTNPPGALALTAGIGVALIWVRKRGYFPHRRKCRPRGSTGSNRVLGPSPVGPAAWVMLGAQTHDVSPSSTRQPRSGAPHVPYLGTFGTRVLTLARALLIKRPELIVPVWSTLMVIGVGMSLWLYGQYRGAGESLLAEAMTAHSGGDCITAVVLFHQVRDKYRLVLPEYVETSQQEMAECELFIRAQDLRQRGETQLAAHVYEEYLRKYPGGVVIGTARAEAVDVEVALVKGGPSSPLLPPPVVGRVSPGTTILRLRNDSPRPIEVLMSGPGSQSWSLEACGTCQEFLLSGPATCPNKGPEIRTSPPIGDYDVVVKAKDGSVRPFSGRWILEQGNEYSHCLFIVSSLR